MYAILVYYICMGARIAISNKEQTIWFLNMLAFNTNLERFSANIFITIISRLSKKDSFSAVFQRPT